MELILENWGTPVIDACKNVKPFNDTFNKFLDHCSACGGNWGGMFLTGIEKLFPEVYKAIPDNMGNNAFFCLVEVLKLCGVKMPED